MNAVLDERSEPPLRVLIGDLLAGCDEADIAIANVRLAALDLSDAELRGVVRCRILLGRLDARALDDGAREDPAAVHRTRALLRFLESGRVAIRSSGLASWAPDLSVFRGQQHTVCLVGAHYFHDPVASGGPSLTCVLTDSAAVHLVAQRFEQLWALGYDVSGAVLSTVRAWLGRIPEVGPDPS